MRRALAAAVAALMAAPAMPAISAMDIRTAAFGIQPGTPVEVRLKQGPKFRGQFMAAGDSELRLKTLASGTVEEREFRYSEVDSIRERPRESWIVRCLAGAGRAFTTLFVIGGVLMIATGGNW